MNRRRPRVKALFDSTASVMLWYAPLLDFLQGLLFEELWPHGMLQRPAAWCHPLNIMWEPPLGLCTDLGLCYKYMHGNVWQIHAANPDKPMQPYLLNPWLGNLPPRATANFLSLDSLRWHLPCLQTHVDNHTNTN